MEISLLFSAFFAGVLTFLAPCTLPLVPGFLGYISGTSVMNAKDQQQRATRTVLLSAVAYVIGFTSVFVLVGSLFGAIGHIFAQYRPLLTKVGGGIVILFGLYLLGLFQIPLLQKLENQYTTPLARRLRPGSPLASFLFGVAFAFGWTPCVGPILGTILLLATNVGTGGYGAILLLVFSLGMAIPFLILALLIGRASQFIHTYSSVLPLISKIAGGFLLLLGGLLLFDHIGWFFELINTWFSLDVVEQFVLDHV